MSPRSVKKQKTHHNPLKTIILAALIVMLLLVLTWHALLPTLGISITELTAGIWNVAITTLIIICVSTLLFFIFTGIGMLLLGIGVLLWTTIAIVLFPLLFPMVLPALLLMLVIGFILRNKKIK